MIFQDKIVLEVNDFVAIVTIDNPPVNALSARVMDGLRECFVELARNDAIRAVILTGAGKAFVAGADIKEFTSWTPEDVDRVGRKGHEIFNLAEDFPAPVIAAVNGIAFGGGLELALVCDIRIASEKAKLGLPETALGICPGYGGLARLAKAVGLGRAKQMIYTAEHVDADAALRMGLVQEVTNASDLMNRAMEIAAKISVNGPVAIRAVKKTLNAARDLSLRDALEMEIMTSVSCYASDDKNEGVDAFLNKRKPAFQNR